MKIDKRFKVRTIVNEHVLLIQGRNDSSMSKVMAFNDSAYLMWNELNDKDFTLEDAQNVLLDNYEVAPEVALEDARKWVQTLVDNGVIL